MTEIVLDLHRRGIHSSAFVTQKDKEEFWEAVTLELLLEREYLDRLKELDPFEILLIRKFGVPLLDWSSDVCSSDLIPLLCRSKKILVIFFSFPDLNKAS